jgi:hypothetical protein
MDHHHVVAASSVDAAEFVVADDAAFVVADGYSAYTLPEPELAMLITAAPELALPSDGSGTCWPKQGSAVDVVSPCSEASRSRGNKGWLRQIQNYVVGACSVANHPIHPRQDESVIMCQFHAYLSDTRTHVL